MVYLIHFDIPYRHARHYLGYATDLNARIQRHRAGTGARLMGVISDAGIRWHVARTWEGTQTLEKALKLQKNSPRLCPICQQERLYQRTLSTLSRRPQPSGQNARMDAAFQNLMSA